MPLNQGPPPSDAPVVDTAEQVFAICSIPVLYIVSYVSLFSFVGIHIVVGPLENAQARSSRSTDGSDGSDARRIC